MEDGFLYNISNPFSNSTVHLHAISYRVKNFGFGVVSDASPGSHPGTGCSMHWSSQIVLGLSPAWNSIVWTGHGVGGRVTALLNSARVLGQNPVVCVCRRGDVCWYPQGKSAPWTPPRAARLLQKVVPPWRSSPRHPHRILLDYSSFGLML